MVSARRRSRSACTWKIGGGFDGNTAMALGADGNVYAWGDGLYGQRGDNSGTSSVTTPVKTQLPPGVAAVSISEGIKQSFAITGAVPSGPKPTFGVAAPPLHTLAGEAYGALFPRQRYADLLVGRCARVAEHHRNHRRGHRYAAHGNHTVHVLGAGHERRRHDDGRIVRRNGRARRHDQRNGSPRTLRTPSKARSSKRVGTTVVATRTRPRTARSASSPVSAAAVVVTGYPTTNAFARVSVGPLTVPAAGITGQELVLPTATGTPPRGSRSAGRRTSRA